MTESRADHLAVIVPTRGRPDILAKTVGALRNQSVEGFEVIVVVDGEESSPPTFPGARVLVQAHAGPGVARNTGVAATDRPLVLFLGDDMIPNPGVVERHLAAHDRHPEPSSAILGHVVWHPQVQRNAIIEWLDWSGNQFDFANIGSDEAGWGRFYSCNVSLKRRFFCDAGGFDPEFAFDYEDLDFAYRLSQRGLRLWYEPGAVVQHLHNYGWERLVRRYEGRARAEQLMMSKHAWFQPFFAGRVRSALDQPDVASFWPEVAARLPDRLTYVRNRAQKRADIAIHQRIAPAFLAAWDDESERFDASTYAKETDRPRPETDPAAGKVRSKLNVLRSLLHPGDRVLDWRSRTGSAGMVVAEWSAQPTFVVEPGWDDDFLRWRLERRGLACDVHHLDQGDVPVGFDVALALDVAESDDDQTRGLLSDLERRAPLVLVDVPVAGAGLVLSRATGLGLLRVSRDADRITVLYRSTATPRQRAWGNAVRAIDAVRTGSRLRIRKSGLRADVLRGTHGATRS